MPFISVERSAHHTVQSAVLAAPQPVEDSVYAPLGLRFLDELVIGFACWGHARHDEVEVERADQLQALDVFLTDGR